MCAISFGHNEPIRTDMIQIDKTLLDYLFAKAKESDRLRMNYDMRTSVEDNSQRMLNALMPGTQVAIHRHPQSDETVIVLCGKMVEVFYDGNGCEIERIHLDPSVGNYGCVVPKGVWHTVEVLEPSVIFEAKDGKYGEDGSETFGTKTITKTESENVESNFSNSLGDLKKNIEYLIGMERQSGSMDVITPIYVSRMLHVPLEEVESAMKEMGQI